jgi:hypothetical protein
MKALRRRDVGPFEVVADEQKRVAGHKNGVMV